MAVYCNNNIELVSTLCEQNAKILALSLTVDSYHQASKSSWLCYCNTFFSGQLSYPIVFILHHLNTSFVTLSPSMRASLKQFSRIFIL
jgi:hypothetical protein